jgi:hypothetical protein
VAGETRLDAALQLDDAAAQIGVDLVRHECLLEHLQLARDLGIESGFGRRGAHVGEHGAVGERVGKGDVGLGPDAFRLVGRVDVRRPPGRVGRGFERLEGRGASRDDVARGHLNQMRW